MIYHLENPVRQPWQDVLALVADKLNLQTVDIVPFEEWIEAVRTCTDDIDANPANKLAEFFEVDFRHMACGNVILDTEKARKASSTLRNMDVVSHKVIAASIDRWKRIGFLMD